MTTKAKIWFPFWKLLLSFIVIVFLMNFALNLANPHLETQPEPDQNYDFQKRKQQFMRKIMQKILKG